MKELRGIRRSGAKRSNDTVPGSRVLLSRGDKLLGTREVEERVGVVVGQPGFVIVDDAHRAGARPFDG